MQFDRDVVEKVVMALGGITLTPMIRDAITGVTSASLAPLESMIGKPFLAIWAMGVFVAAIEQYRKTPAGFPWEADVAEQVDYVIHAVVVTGALVFGMCNALEADCSFQIPAIGWVLVAGCLATLAAIVVDAFTAAPVSPPTSEVQTALVKTVKFAPPVPEVAQPLPASKPAEGGAAAEGVAGFSDEDELASY